MTYGILCIVLTGFLWGLVGLLHSIVARRRLNFPAYSAISSLAGAAFTWAFYVRWTPVVEGAVTRTAGLSTVVTASALLSVAAFMLTQRAMRGGHHAGAWTIAQSSLVWPFLAGVTFWGDPLTGPRLVGAIIILGGVLAFGRSHAAEDDEPADAGKTGRWFLPALAAFVLLGGHQTLLQAPSHWPGWTDAGNLRVPMFMTVMGLAYGILAVAKRTRPRRVEILLGLLGAVIGAVSQACLFSGMDALSVTGAGAIVYPVAIGVCILTFALYSIAILREPTNRYHVIGLAACLIGVAVIAL